MHVRNATATAESVVDDDDDDVTDLGAFRVEPFFPSILFAPAEEQSGRARPLKTDGVSHLFPF